MTLEFNQAVDSVISIDNVIENIDISITPESSSISSTPIDVTLSSSGELNIEIVVSNDPVPLRVDIDTYGPIYVDVNTNQTIDFSVELNTDINKGEKGDDGDTGPQGPRGERGEKGDRGDVGATGVTGPAGSTGLDGVKGDKGDKGDLGLTGAKGDKGDQGNQGFKGDKGDTGPAGVKGDQGVQGIQGRDGLTTSVNGVTQIDGNVTLTKSDIGLGDVDDTSDLNKPISTATQSALDLKLGLNAPITAGSNSKITYDSNGLVLSSSKADISDIADLASTLSNKLETSLKGAANGLAELDSSGFVKNTQLPSYVDDVLEYSSLSLFPVVGESGKIYIDTTTNLTYRWSGSTYALVSQSLALGETSSTAYRGDRGKTAYDHSQILSGNPHGTIYGWTEITSKPTTLSGYGITDAIQNQQSAAQVGGLWVSQLIKTSYGITVLHSGNDNPSVAPFINFQDPSFSVSNSISMNGTGGLSVNNYQSGVGTVKTFTISKEGNITALGYYTGTQYKVVGGTSSQYLKADGSLDANTYQPLGTAINTGNIAGQSVNYANVSGNATNWSGYELDFDQAVSVNRLIAFDSSDNTFRVADAPSVKSWLSYGSAANNNTGDFYAAGSTVANSTLWSAQGYANTPQPADYIMTTNGAGTWGYATKTQFKSDLGLGSSAYTNTNDHILNQNASAQSASFNITGDGIIGGDVRLTGLIKSTTEFGNNISLYGSNADMIFNTAYGNPYGGFKFNHVGATVLSLNSDNSATFASTVNATQLQSTVATGTAPLTVNSTTMVRNLNAEYLGGYENAHFAKTYDATSLIDNWNNFNPSSSTDRGVIVRVDDNVKLGLPQTGIYNWSLYQQGNVDRGSQLALGAYGGNEMYYRSAQNDDNVWRPWVKLYHSGNLTNTLSTNYIPKWNGSSMVNSLISDDSNLVYINNTKGIYISGDDPSTSYWLRLNNINGGNQYSLISGIVGETNTGFSLRNITANRTEYKINGNGDFIIPSSTPSTSPTTGALVVGGGIGVASSSTFGDNANPPIKWGSTSETYGMLDWFSAGFAAIYGVSGRGLTLGANGQINMINIYNNGNTSMGYTTDQGYKLAVNGTGYFSGNVTASNFILSSDRTLKTNIQSIDKDYSKLNLVSFNFKDNLDELRFGTIAQDLLSNGYSEFVTGDKDGEYKVKYIDLIIAKLASAELRIKELEDKYGSR